MNTKLTTLLTALTSAVADAKTNAGPHAVTALSGGVDSCLIAATSHLPAIAVGASASHDLDAARHAATLLNIPLTIYEIPFSEIPRALADIIPYLPSLTAMDAEIAVTEYFICNLAKETGATAILTGQGADELFAGYARYGTTKHLTTALKQDLATYPTQQTRDRAVAALFGITFYQPFMDPRVISAAQTFLPEELISGDLRKIALRKAAESYIPAELAWKPKKAMQYGSGVSKMIAKHAKLQKVTPQKYIEQFGKN